MPQTHFNIFHPSTFTRAKCQDPSQLFLYSNQIKFLSYNFLTDSTSKTIVDDANISPKDFAYLLTCCPSVLIYRGGQHNHAEVYRLAHLCRYFGYKKQLPRIADSWLLPNTILIKANNHCRECKRHRTNSTLEVPTHQGKVIVAYALWWHRISRGT